MILNYRLCFVILILLSVMILFLNPCSIPASDDFCVHFESIILKCDSCHKAYSYCPSCGYVVVNCYCYNVAMDYYKRNK